MDQYLANRNAVEAYARQLFTISGILTPYASLMSQLADERGPSHEKDRLITEGKILTLVSLAKLLERSGGTRVSYFKLDDGPPRALREDKHYSGTLSTQERLILSDEAERYFLEKLDQHRTWFRADIVRDSFPGSVRIEGGARASYLHPLPLPRTFMGCL